MSRTHVLALLLAASASPALAQSSYRIATYNASLNRGSAGELATDLSTPGEVQAQRIAEVIQRVNPDVILLNEFDVDLSGQTAADFQTNYLGIGQNGATPINFGHVYVAASNTGVLSGFDLNNDGTTATPANAGSFTYANDSFGFGQFEGQFGFAIFSKHPIDVSGVRTFQEFLWKDMPGNLLTNDPTANNLNAFYSPAEIDALRLSSKNHVDVPITLGGETVHLLAAHPTPPVFDGAEDRNGKRNHDEIRFWNDYVEGDSYFYDDGGQTGGLAADSRFVILGDYNADPFDGDSFAGAANQFFANPAINGSETDGVVTPSSPGGTEQAIAQGGINTSHTGDPAFDTADFGDGSPGNLRVDYALPSTFGLEYDGGGVFWPASNDPAFGLVGASDHRLVYVDVSVVIPEPTAALLMMAAVFGVGSTRR